MTRGFLLCIAVAGCGAPLPPENNLGDPADLARAVTDGGGGEGCTPKCAGLTPHCNPSRRCVGCLSDDHCGAGTYCKVVSEAIATCVPGCKDDARCGAGRKCCNAQCADVMNSASHCGACGKVCTGLHATGACVAGKCQSSGKCDPGWGDCNGNPADGCETNLHIDPNHCTACGMKCAIANAINACADGCYVTACQFGFDDCNRDEKDGCEKNVQADAANCGACNRPCKSLPNAGAACVNGACVLGQCNMGYFNCDNDPTNGCESDLVNDPKNCGGCGRPCPQNLPFCGNSICQAQPTGCFRLTDVKMNNGGVKDQYTKCEKLADNGFTCINPLVRYGNVPNGVPAMHPSNSFDLWCKQVGCKGFANNVSYGARDFAAPYGKLFWCSGYDENVPHWCDWQDGNWYNQQLDYHQAGNDGITSITCN